MNKNPVISDSIEAVITSYNQKEMILEAVRALCNQTIVPNRIVIVDDGSTDEESLEVLENIKNSNDFLIPIYIHFKNNGGVSSARNAGINQTKSPLILILDGDDTLEPTYVEEVGLMFNNNPLMIAASSWIKTFGVLEATVRPTGGSLIQFLSKNCCPAPHILRRETYDKISGYDEKMLTGFEDWEFFISLLEITPKGYIGIIEKPLINYRTKPISLNIKSMEKRLEIMRYIMEKHLKSYQSNVVEALLGIESISNKRLYSWEEEIIDSINNKMELSKASSEFVKHPTYGDGGMASAVRIKTFTTTS